MADVERGEEEPVLAAPCRDKTLPANIRVGFISKVYGLVTYMLTVTFTIAAPFVFRPVETKLFFDQHPSLTVLSSGVFLGMYVLNFCLIGSALCGNGKFVRQYMSMFRTAPQNFIFLTVVAAAFGVLAGFTCAQYTAQSVLMVFALAAFLIACLTMYAVHTDADFTGMRGYAFMLIIGLLSTSLLCVFFPGPFMHKVVAGFGAIAFSFLIVHDTQLIFGESALNPGAKRQIEYSVDMYAFAAYQLYLDFINYFLYLLQLLGDRR